MRQNQRVAVIGAACRFPGAPDLAAFGELLRAGRSAIREVPASRWSVAELYRPRPELGKSLSKWGGFLDELEYFDAAYFRLSAEEATCLDPSVRLMLEAVESCVADSGRTAAELAGRPIGVFAGARASDYWRRTGLRSGSAGFGSDQNFIAARLGQHLDLRGPCFVVDSACSSALVAVQLAVRSLLADECELAFAGGVEVLLDERPYLEFSAAQALSPTGRCRPFDERADGLVPGEGCGVVLLKRLEDAVRDGDRIRAVIDAVAVNNDGRTVGLTTPNPAAQRAVIEAALDRSGWRATDVALVEAHGTGTALGDPIELRALTETFTSRGQRPGACAVGSVKSNFGHLFSAAGIAGLLKVVLALERGELYPTLSCDRPNPRFDFARSPFHPITEARPWPRDRAARVAGVSAFGLGGTNAHLIASALTADQAAAPSRAPLPLPRYQRERLWLDRDGRAAPAPVSAPVSAPVPAPVPTPAPAPQARRSSMSSLSQLEFLDGKHS
ncbi:MAG: polyketide synthase [Myxococcales bacterium]|nr:polyketide synthase [Myxococcales bacterium]